MRTRPSASPAPPSPTISTVWERTAAIVPSNLVMLAIMCVPSRRHFRYLQARPRLDRPIVAGFEATYRPRQILVALFTRIRLVPSSFFRGDRTVADCNYRADCPRSRWDPKSLATQGGNASHKREAIKNSTYVPHVRDHTTVLTVDPAKSWGGFSRDRPAGSAG